MLVKKSAKFFCSSGGEQVFAVTSGEHVYAWGYDKYFQLGLFSQVHEEEMEELKKKRGRKKEEEGGRGSQKSQGG